MVIDTWVFVVLQLCFAFFGGRTLGALLYRLESRLDDDHGLKSDPYARTECAVTMGLWSYFIILGYCISSGGKSKSLTIGLPLLAVLNLLLPALIVAMRYFRQSIYAVFMTVIDGSSDWLINLLFAAISRIASTLWQAIDLFAKFVDFCRARLIKKINGWRGVTRQE